MIWTLRSLFAWSDKKSSIHPDPLQHVLSLMTGELLMEPRLTKMAVLLWHWVAKNLLKCRAFQWIHLRFVNMYIIYIMSYARECEHTHTQ